MTKSIWLESRFFLYATGNVVNNLGSSLYMFAMPLLVYFLTKSAVSMSIMAVCEVLPQVVLSLFIGALVDRLSRRTIIFTTLIFQSLCCLALVLLFSSGVLQIWMLYLAGALLSTGQVFLRTAQFAVIPVMFTDRKAEASAGISSAFTLTSIIGPFVAGVLIIYVDYITFFLINALTYFAPIILCIWTRIPHERNLGGVRSLRQIGSDTKDGLVFIRNQEVLVSFVVVIGLSNLADSGMLTVLLYHLKHDYLSTDRYVSFVLLAHGIGSFIGTLLPARFKHIPKGKFFFLSLLVNNVGLMLFLVPTWWIAPMALFICGIGAKALIVAYNIMLQEMVPNQMLGRVGGGMRTLLAVTYPVSLAVLGTITEGFGAQMAFITMAVLSIIPLLLILKGPLYSYQKEPNS